MYAVIAEMYASKWYHFNCFSLSAV